MPTRLTSQRGQHTMAILERPTLSKHVRFERGEQCRLVHFDCDSCVRLFVASVLRIDDSLMDDGADETESMA